MMNKPRQITVSPVDVPKDTFVLGDISLRIAPSQIEVRKEDLTYRYRTLRSKVSTKVNTGSGQISIHLSIPFVEEQLLELHRLIVEIRTNPFVYIDNRYLRESIVPDWPYAQSMAFTITGVGLTNAPNATDLWNLELDATWFNYFPFAHNFLFREEWQTNWMRSEIQGDDLLQSFTIGWQLDSNGKRQHYANPVDSLTGSNGPIGLINDKWSVTQSKILNTDNIRTIEDMQTLHPGVEFDLLPLPGNMMPANIVTQPINSRIFVRYYNFLQRDAFKESFNIDVRADVLEWEEQNNTVGLFDSLFGVGKDKDGLPTVIPLHSLLLPAELRKKWIKQMLIYNSGVRFHFHVFKEIRMPQKWMDSLDNKKNSVVHDLFGRLQAVKDLAVIQQGTADGDERAIPVLGAKFRISSEFGYRNHPTEGQYKHHNGVDIAAPLGTPILTPEAGEVVQVGFDSISGNFVKFKTKDGGVWAFCHMDLVAVQTGQGSPLSPDGYLTPGTILGTVGSTGRSTGPHLHLMYTPISGGTPVDPLPYLAQILAVEEHAEQAADLFAPTLDGQEPGTAFDYSEVQTANSVELTDSEQIVELAKTQARESLKLNEEEASALADLLDVLAAEGWSIYDADTTVTNVWKKLLTLEIANSGLDVVAGRSEFPEEFTNSGIILTNVSASLSHIVAHIPVLSHEFPTQQHLGSVEPEYQLEFAVLDDQSDLEGISQIAQLVQGMRSMLQSNSRRFRPVLDGWCVATDTFITRLFGSYKVNDYLRLDMDGIVADVDLKKRTIISSSYDGTVPGNPGLSTIALSLQETNPYVSEELVSTAPILADKEAARGQVLRAINSLDLDPKYRDQLAPLFVAQKLGANLTDPSQPDFGKFSIAKLGGPFNVQPTEISQYANNDVLFYNENGVQRLLIKQNSPNDIDMLKSLGLEPDYYSPNGQETGYIQINPNEMDGYTLGDIDYSETRLMGTLLGTAALGPIGYPYLVDSGTGTYSGKPLDPTVLENSRFQVAGANVLLYPSATVFDVSSLAEQNPALAQMSIQKLMDYNVTVANFIQTGNRMFSETEVGGLDKAYILNELYGLPFRQDMWKYWQMFLEEFVKLHNTSSVSAALTELHDNTAWPRPGKEYWSDPLPEAARYQIASAANTNFGFQGSPTATLLDNTFGTNTSEKLSIGLATGFNGLEQYTSVYNDARKAAVNRLVNQYMRSMPIAVALPEYLKLQYQYVIGDYLGNWSQDERGKTPALDSMHDYFIQNATSVGNITYESFITNNPVWQSKDTNYDVIRNVTASSFNAVKGVVPIIGAVPAASLGLATLKMQASNELPAGPTDLGSPFAYPVEQGFEQTKVMYIKGLLAAVADDILGDYRVLQMLGLENLMFLDEGRSYQGLECYPDLDLPAHPYYGSTAYVYPDFYFWNIYEDGGALQFDQLKAIQEQVDFVVENAYTSMKKMSSGSRFDERSESQSLELSVDNPLVITTRITPEGTDGQADGSGPMDSPFAPVKAAKPATEKWKKDMSDGDWGPKLSSDKPSEYIEGIRLGNTEGLYGQRGSRQYPARASDAHYDILQKQFDKTTSLFGSVEGYMSRELNAANMPSVYDAIQGKLIQRPPEAAHTFDVDSLKQLARDSSKDLISQKMSMKRAFPTYKLFFIEEDEFETRFINFDDFYSYNAVKEIVVTQSRKIAADTAIITLQNISGTLDGTRRSSVADLDYYNETNSGNVAGQKLAAQGDTTSSTLANDPITAGTSSNQPFGSMVLRPGLNVQLRMGFSNQADCLHVMLSGRVVDVTWNKTGDLAEIMVQSFGAELEQVIKGTARDGSVRTFATTHELLGSLMLEPEVVHFGRWEFGQQFQVREAKDYRLDFTEYSKEGYLGRWGTTTWLARWVSNHPYLTLGLAGLGSAATMLPVGRGFGAISKLFGKVPGLAKIAPSIASAGGVRGIGLGGYVAGFTGVDEVGKAAAFASSTARLGAIARRTSSLLDDAGKVEFEKVLATKAAQALDDFGKATNAAEQGAALAKLESYMLSTQFKSKWMNQPWVELSKGTVLTALGPKFAGSVTSLLIGTPAATLTVGFLSAVLIDQIIQQVFQPIYNSTIGGAQKFFARTNATLFLTPQDDNLFPPHPKDYMTLDKGWWRTYRIDPAIAATASITGFTPEDAQRASEFIFPDTILSKKVDPNDCNYQIVSSSIWDVFHEMTLRHPGWIYGARPYGNLFRYTMFFGLPGQRYWARPASNAFITRTNQLFGFINSVGPGKTRVTEYEFRTLYGDQRFNELKEQINNLDLTGLPIDSTFHTSPGQRQAIQGPAAALDFIGETGREVDPDLASSLESRIGAITSQSSRKATESIAQGLLAQQMSAIAIAEYLRAVQIRFEPFRRYHLVTSERDIVWNGIMGSENAVANAVDVTYFPSVGDRTDPENAQIRTAVFKAHSFIPESKLRIAPVRWYNCLGYGMAQRYAMGELCNNMRDMYRGELITLGNPRIRPWDVCVLVDSYNSMTGPIEVEQVVHTYSHETGFLTEIKPSAVVYANEISGWPVMEAMKIFSLAIQDIHNRYAGVKADNGSDSSDPGSLVGVSKLFADAPGLWGLAGHSDKYDSFINAKYKKFFGDEGASVANMWNNEPPPNLDSIDSYVNEIYNNAMFASTAIGVAGAASAVVGGVKTLELAGQAGGDGVKMLKQFVKTPSNLKYGAGLILGLGAAGVGFGAPLALSQVDFPGMAFLLGGESLFLQCLRNDAIILVPLTKSGTPIVAGLAFNDPALMWRSFRGVLNRTFTETLQGTNQLLDLWGKYNSEIWTRVKDIDLAGDYKNAVRSGIPGVLRKPVDTSIDYELMEKLTGGSP